MKEKSKKDKRNILCTHRHRPCYSCWRLEMTRSSCMLRALELTAGQKLRIFAHNPVSLPPLSLRRNLLDRASSAPPPFWFFLHGLFACRTCRSLLLPNIIGYILRKTMPCKVRRGSGQFEMKHEFFVKTFHSMMMTEDAKNLSFSSQSISIFFSLGIYSYAINKYRLYIPEYTHSLDMCFSISIFCCCFFPGT